MKPSDPSADAQRIGEIVRRMCDGAFNADWSDVEWLLQRVAQAEQERDDARVLYDQAIALTREAGADLAAARLRGREEH